jgi:hypothetical protein
VGISALAKDTAFDLTTRPAPVLPLLEVLPSNGGQFRLRMTGEADRNYHLQGSTNFQAWVDLLVTNPPLSTVVYTDVESSAFRQRFYRAQLGP